MKKILKVFLLLLFFGFLFGLFIAIRETISHPEKYQISQIEDVEQFSRISEKELEKLMGGKPSSVEKWKNKVLGKEYKLKTFAYDKNNNHYEFIIFKKKVVRLSIYSSGYWTNEGERFPIKGNISNVLKAYNIKLSDYSKVKVDNNYTYQIALVNEKVADFNIQDIKDNSYGFVKITYDMRCFE